MICTKQEYLKKMKKRHEAGYACATFGLSGVLIVVLFLREVIGINPYFDLVIAALFIFGVLGIVIGLLIMLYVKVATAPTL